MTPPHCKTQSIRENANVIDEILNPPKKDNPQKARTPQEIAKERHANRTPEREEQLREYWEKKKAEGDIRRKNDARIKTTANNVLTTVEKRGFSDFSEIDTTALQDAINSGDTTLIKQETKALAQQMSALQKQIRTDAKGMITKAADFGEVDTSALNAALTSSKLADIKAKTNALQVQIKAMEAQEQALSDLIPDAHTWHKSVSMAELQGVYAAVEKKLASWSSLSLEQQAKKLYFEAYTFLGGNMNNVQSKYPTTWKISQAAYVKKLAEVNYQIDVNAAKSELSVISSWSANHPKSLKVANLLADAENAIKANEDIAVIKHKVALAQTEHKKRLAEQARRDAKKGVTFAEMEPTIVQKLLDEYRTNTVAKMDRSLRPITKSGWGNLTDEEKFVVTKYTQTYCYLNEPLRGITYTGTRPKSEYRHDLPILTSALNKFKTAKDMVVRRGVRIYHIPELGKDLDKVQVGEEFTDGGFLSTSAHRDKGFIDTMNLVILVPKGARGIFAEPFSHYTDNGKFDFEKNKIWDGVSKEYIGSEFEWIGQRGSRFKVLKVVGRTLYLQIIGQLK